MANKYLPGLVFIFMAGTVTQIAFGWIGFNPTDEGFVLEGSYRILFGQWPHADFASIRPALSCYLHIPEVLFGGSYTLYLSRYVGFLQLAAVAWWWTILLQRNDPRPYPLLFLHAAIAFCLSVHTFPVTAIHTIDGIFLFTLAIVLAQKEKWIWASVFAGMAILCKQSFVFGLPVLALVYSRNRAKLLLPGAILILLYLAVFFSFAGKGLLLQLQGQTGFYEAAIRSFVISEGFWGGLVAGIIFSLSARYNYLGGVFIFLLALTGLAFNKYIGQVSFAIFGMGLGIFLVKDRRTVPFLLLSLAWMSTVSVGYNSPALLTGPLMVFILSRTEAFTRHKLEPVMAGFLTLAVFSYARLMYPYREATFLQCDYPVGKVMPAGKGVFTNARTYAVLKELDSLKTAYPSAVPLPDMTASWLNSGQISPVPSLWPNKTETASVYVKTRLGNAIRDSKNVWLVSRYLTADLAYNATPIENVSPYPVVELIQKLKKPIDSTYYFIVYR